jgi:hypothetical protein
MVLRRRLIPLIFIAEYLSKKTPAEMAATSAAWSPVERILGGTDSQSFSTLQRPEKPEKTSCFDQKTRLFSQEDREASEEPEFVFFQCPTWEFFRYPGRMVHFSLTIHSFSDDRPTAEFDFFRKCRSSTKPNLIISTITSRSIYESTAAKKILETGTEVSRIP